MKKYNRTLISISKISLAVFSFTIGFNTSFAQDVNNAAGKLTLASNDFIETKSPTEVIETKRTVNFVTKEANIVYPTVLKGNEEQSLEYVEKFSKNRRDYLIRTYKKSKKYFPKVAAILRKHGLTKEYQVLLPLESGFNGNAVSGAGAVGYWQIMDFVAQEYGLTYERQLSAEEKKKLEDEKLVAATKGTMVVAEKKAVVQDDRKNFVKSTNTAARYLRDRTRNLGNDILLIVASYNCGIGNVYKAKQKTGLSNPTFWDAKKFLPSETQAYVMNFITLNVLFNNYQKFENNSLTFKSEKIKVITDIPEKIKIVTEQQIIEQLDVVYKNGWDF
jgi:membrane-bound lytic murein transglycosylase D